ncbi:hypothetical protein DFH09DRAFT_1105642 [Mycena vulgaris]|nr:hypothetical protein DFH09DRAFT_1105642 [Mycena vulgaris]
MYSGRLPAKGTKRAGITDKPSTRPTDSGPIPKMTEYRAWCATRGGPRRALNDVPPGMVNGCLTATKSGLQVASYSCVWIRWFRRGAQHGRLFDLWPLKYFAADAGAIINR